MHNVSLAPLEEHRRALGVLAGDFAVDLEPLLLQNGKSGVSGVRREVVRLLAAFSTRLRNMAEALDDECKRIELAPETMQQLQSSDKKERAKRAVAPDHKESVHKARR
uniref:Uncharacterized protein n=1 Tax=Lotharella globosa TaxID=91324 RepID=A0A7S4DQL2_9EUKA